MGDRRVRDVVGWTVQDPPRELVAARAVTSAVNVVWVAVTLGAAATGAPARPTWYLPDDPDAFVDIGPVRLTGRAPWLPGPARDAHRVRATQREAYVVARNDERPASALPLRRLRVTAARSHSRARRSRHPDAPWVLTLTDGDAVLDLSGPWLALAWLGHLAGWPEP